MERQKARLDSVGISCLGRSSSGKEGGGRKGEVEPTSTHITCSGIMVV